MSALTKLGLSGLEIMVHTCKSGRFCECHSHLLNVHMYMFILTMYFLWQFALYCNHVSQEQVLIIIFLHV